MDTDERAKLAKSIDRDADTMTKLNTSTWTVVAAISIYGLFIVVPFLTSHGIPGGTAWMLPTAVDAAFVISICATGLLARHGVRAGWIVLLRWVSGLMALGLALAPPLTADPVKGGDVVTHGFGPALLFFTVEGLAQFQVKLGAALRAKREQLTAAERRRDDLTDRARTAEAERAEALRRLSALESETAAVIAERDSLAVSGEAAETAAETLRRRLSEQAETLRAQHNTVVERLSGEHRETLRRASEKHAESLRALRAELTTVNLSDRRKAAVTSGGESPRPAAVKPVKGSPLSDDECLRRMLSVSTDPAHQWTGPALRELTGAGYSRIPRLIEAWTERVTAPSADHAAAQ